jgi:hypothetical protein
MRDVSMLTGLMSTGMMSVGFKSTGAPFPTASHPDRVAIARLQHMRRADWASRRSLRGRHLACQTDLALPSLRQHHREIELNGSGC